MEASPSRSLWPISRRNQSAGDTGSLLNFSIWALAGFSAAFLGLRVFGKLRRGRKLWWDDHILVAAWVRDAEFVPCGEED